jgi:hypothetical protein
VKGYKPNVWIALRKLERVLSSNGGTQAIAIEVVMDSMRKIGWKRKRKKTTMISWGMRYLYLFNGHSKGGS